MVMGFVHLVDWYFLRQVTKGLCCLLDTLTRRRLLSRWFRSFSSLFSSTYYHTIPHYPTTLAGKKRRVRGQGDRVCPPFTTSIFPEHLWLQQPRGGWRTLWRGATRLLSSAKDSSLSLSLYIWMNTSITVPYTSCPCSKWNTVWNTEEDHYLQLA